MARKSSRVAIHCPHCGQKHVTSQIYDGTLKRCSNCGQKFKVNAGCAGAAALLAAALAGILIAWPSFASQQPPVVAAPDYVAMKRQWIEEATDRAEEAKARAIANLGSDYDSRIRATKDRLAELSDMSVPRSQYAAARKQIDECRASIAKLQTEKVERIKKAKAAPLRLVPNLYLRDIQVGSFGKLGESQFDPTPPLFRLTQVIDNNNAIMSLGSLTLWVEMTTAGLVDGTRIELIDFVHCTGTRRYETVVGGTRTVFVLKMIK
jgi:hypothetical protein